MGCGGSKEAVQERDDEVPAAALNASAISDPPSTSRATPREDGKPATESGLPEIAGGQSGAPALGKSIDHLPASKPRSGAVDTSAAAEVQKPAAVGGRPAVPAMELAHAAVSAPPMDTAFAKAAPELAHAVPAPAAEPVADPAHASVPGTAGTPVDPERGSEVRTSRLFDGSGLAANDAGKLPPISSSLGGSGASAASSLPPVVAPRILNTSMRAGGRHDGNSSSPGADDNSNAPSASMRPPSGSGLNSSLRRAPSGGSSGPNDSGLRAGIRPTSGSSSGLNGSLRRTCSTNTNASPAAAPHLPVGPGSCAAGSAGGALPPARPSGSGGGARTLRVSSSMSRQHIIGGEVLDGIVATSERSSRALHEAPVADVDVDRRPSLPMSVDDHPAEVLDRPTPSTKQQQQQQPTLLDAVTDPWSQLQSKYAVVASPGGKGPAPRLVARRSSQQVESDEDEVVVEESAGQQPRTSVGDTFVPGSRSYRVGRLGSSRPGSGASSNGGAPAEVAPAPAGVNQGGWGQGELASKGTLMMGGGAAPAVAPQQRLRLRSCGGVMQPSASPVLPANGPAPRGADDMGMEDLDDTDINALIQQEDSNGGLKADLAAKLRAFEAAAEDDC